MLVKFFEQLASKEDAELEELLAFLSNSIDYFEVPVNLNYSWVFLGLEACLKYYFISSQKLPYLTHC